MKAFVVILFVSIAAFSCKDEDNSPTACGVSDPTSIPWLKAKIDQYKGDSFESTMYLSQGEYPDGTFVFWFGSCCTTCDIRIEFYGCDGKTVDRSPFLNSMPLTNTKVIWKGDNFECQLN